MLVTMMFLVVAKKSRTFSSFSYSANEQVCRSWAGAQPCRQPSWAMEIFHTIGVLLSLGMGVGQGAGSYLLSCFHQFKFSLVWEFGLFQEFYEICKVNEFGALHHCLATGCESFVGW